MSALHTLLRYFAYAALFAGLLAGLLAMYHSLTADQFDVLGPLMVVLLLAGVTVWALWRDRCGRRDGAPKTRTRGQRGKHAVRPPELPAIPPSADAATESIPVVQDVTEVLPAVPAPVPVRLAAAKKDTLYPDWPTDQFRIDIALIDASRPGGAE